MKADNNSTPGIPGGNPLRSPLPNALELDEAIERRLAAFDAIPVEVRRAAWTVAAAMQRLSAIGALEVILCVGRVAERQLGATRLQ
jgi:hypothetical protein